MSFLNEDYKIPTTTNYMKFQQGENTFRVLSSAITGYSYWTTDNKPVRSKTEPKHIPENIRTDDTDGSFKINHFWAFVVWNYNDKKIQVLEINQKGIMKFMLSLVNNKKWGDPKGYDIVITKTGSGFDTEYSCVSNPHSPVEKEIQEALNLMTIDLEELYIGGDPFKPSEKAGNDFELPEVQVDGMDAEYEAKMANPKA